jgi:hypothetical protein
MTSEQFGGLVRTVIAALGGYAAGQGWFDADTWVAIAGAASVLGAALWSFYTKKKTA